MSTQENTNSDAQTLAKLLAVRTGTTPSDWDVTPAAVQNDGTEQPSYRAVCKGKSAQQPRYAVTANLV